ncbi:MAG: hypothetical protein NTW55_06325 [Planctomycetota bacterium]|nr:hypothetical protein [Planctomycetota bacterium]
MSDDKITLDKLLSLINVMDSYNPDEKLELRNNCEYAIQQFGDNWIQNEDSRKHPLWGFFGMSPGISELGELGLALKKLQSKENYSDLLERLRSSVKFNGAYYEIIAGYWLLKSEISFEFLKPKKNDKTPDIKFSSSQRDLILEITTKEYSEDYLKTFQNCRKISNLLLLNSSGLRYHVKNHRPLLSPYTTDDILQACEVLLEKAKVSGFEELHLQKIIDLYIFREGNQEKVPKKDRVNIFKMPKSDEYARVRGTIQKKAKQLGQDLPGVLLIFDPFFWPSSKIGFSTSKLRHELEEKIY